MPSRKALLIALAVSFGIYLVPVIGPHAMFFLGGSIFLPHDPKWTGANLALAVALQAVGFAMLYWVFRKPSLKRALLPLLTFPFVFATIQYAYMVAIPTRFLEQPDTSPELVSWPVECTVAKYSQTDLRTNSELWVRSDANPNQYAVLTMPGCKLTNVDLPQPTLQPGGRVDFMIQPTSAIAGMRAVIQKQETGPGRTFWFVASPGSLVPLDAPADPTAPILSTDGKWFAWIQLIPNSGPALQKIQLRSHEGAQKTIDLSSLGYASHVLKSVDLSAGEILLWETDHLIAIDLDGNLRREFPRPTTARPQYNTYLPVKDGFLAWDAYRDQGQYSVEWSFASTRGLHPDPLGRMIHSVATDANGRWIAISVGTSLNIGSARDSVYVLRATDGVEVFRRYLPRYSRSSVAFLDNRHFVLTDPTAGVQVFQTPE